MKSAVIALSTVITLSCLSCKRNIDNATVTVDTVETDFFEALEEANARKTYQGEFPFPGFQARFIELLIDESKMTFTLNDTYRSETGNDSLTVKSGTFERNTGVENTQEILKLITEDGASSFYFQASGDTLLIKTDSTGVKTEEIQLRRL